MQRQGDEIREDDDLDVYLATLSDGEREEIETAGVAIDLAVLLHHARAARGLTQSAAARRAGLAQQAVSRFERPSANLRLDTLQRYLSALGYVVEITVKDAASNAVAARLSLPPQDSDDAADARHSAA
jgi:transcriptional regulator with XRE-family HTH domain